MQCRKHEGAYLRGFAALLFRPDGCPIDGCRVPRRATNGAGSGAWTSNAGPGEDGTILRRQTPAHDASARVRRYCRIRRCRRDAGRGLSGSACWTALQTRSPARRSGMIVEPRPDGIPSGAAQLARNSLARGIRWWRCRSAHLLLAWQGRLFRCARLHGNAGIDRVDTRSDLLGRSSRFFGGTRSACFLATKVTASFALRRRIHGGGFGSCAAQAGAASTFCAVAYGNSPAPMCGRSTRCRALLGGRSGLFRQRAACA